MRFLLFGTDKRGIIDLVMYCGGVFLEFYVA